MKPGAFLVTTVMSGLFAAGIMWNYNWNLMQHYIPVEGRIASVQIDCYVQTPFREITTGSERHSPLAYMPCDVAAKEAARFGFGHDAVKQSVTATYTYVSPVNGRSYRGKTEFRGYRRAEQVPVGRIVPVFAHTDDPSDSRIVQENIFLREEHTVSVRGG